MKIAEHRAEHRILELIKLKGEILQSEIPKILGFSKSTVSCALKKLENEGLIIREKVAGKSYRIWYFENAPKPCEILRVGILRASEYPHVVNALEKMDGIKYHVRVFDSAIELTKMLTSCKVDLGFSPFITQTVFALLLKSLKIHCIVAMNGSGLIYKGDLKSCKTFATSEFSAMESNLKLLLEKLNFNIYDLKFFYFNSAEKALEDFVLGKYDAIAVWEPHFTIANGNKLQFREIIGDYPCCSMASNIEFYKSNKKIVREFKSCIKESVDELDDKNIRYNSAKLLSKILGFDSKIILKSFNSYKFVCMSPNFKFLERYGIKITKNNVESIAAEI